MRARVLRSESGWPSRSTRPSLARHKPKRILTRVVLPARFGPKSAKISPACTAKLTPRSACTVRAERNGARYVLLTSTKSATAVDMIHRLFENQLLEPAARARLPLLALRAHCQNSAARARVDLACAAGSLPKLRSASKVVLAC